MRIALASLCLIAVIGTLAALDLPIRLSWESHNEVSYLPSQTEKEYNWREFYRIGMGVDSLRTGNLTTSFLLQSRADFINNQVELRHFELNYHLPFLTVSAASELTGYGKADCLNPLSRISATHEDYRYQATRFNRIGAERNGLLLAAGGNQHNQPMLKLSYANGLDAANLQYRISQEARIHDSHWSSPVSISAVELSCWSPQVSVNAESAFSHFYAYDNTPAHNSSYAILESRLQLLSGLVLYASGEYRETEPNGLITRFLDASLTAGKGKLLFSPGFRIDASGSDSVADAYFGVDWLFLPGQRLGVLYRCENFKTPNHILGLQAALNCSL